jgi:hypothetical protein
VNAEETKLLRHIQLILGAMLACDVLILVVAALFVLG